MNRIHKVMWSAAHGRMVVVSELTKGSRGKKSGRRRLAHALITCAALAGSAHAEDVLPTGANIVSGAANVTTTDGSMRVDQTTDKLIANWQSFSIGEGNSVTFNQPGASAVALNRVVGQDPSKILGSLNANGQVFLLNPNGVVFGRSAQVSAGAFAASTLGLRDEDFLSGRYELSGDRGSILNEGTLKGSVVALIAPTVANAGTIEGNTALAAGTNVALDFNGDGLLSVEVRDSTLATLVENRGLIQANGGVAILTAQGASSALAGVVSNSGVVQANSIERRGGRIVLEVQDGRVSSSGTLDVSSRDERGGRVVVTGDQTLIADGARLDATGGRGGGEIYVGGGWQGSDPAIYQATETVVASGATLDASATGYGDGGTVVAWSDIHNPNSVTTATGTFLARGGANGGNGGRIETSGHSIETAGVRGSAGASAGNAGLWLFDPYNVTISSSADAGGSFSSGTWTPSGSGSNILNTNINALLDGGTNVTVTTGVTGGEIGDIVVNAPITRSAGTTDVTLTLRAANSIRVNEAITSTSGRMNVLLDADNNNGSADGAGVVMAFNDIVTNGGDLNFGTGRTLFIGGVSTLVGGDVFVAGTGARTFSTSGGNINVRGELILANTSGLTVESGGGNILFSGLLNSGNAYSYVDGPDNTGSWSWARTEAKNGTAGGSAVDDSYLINITSRLENSVAASTGDYRGAWIGAHRPDLTQPAWRWADGPESGVLFFDQNATNNGGTATPGYYSNFGGGEPNGCRTAGCEGVGQFYGTLGQWNDLPDTTLFSPTQVNEYRVLGYVRETNLPESPLIVNAGTGSVTFSGAVGNTKALASLDVTGSSISVAAGARASGTINANAMSGNLSIAGAISSGDTTAAAIVLNAGRNGSAGDASGGNILAAGGTTITTGTGGRATLYTGSVSGSTGLTSLVGNGSARFRYNSDEISTNYTAPLGSGTYAIYREQPLVTVTTSGGTITYGQALPALSVDASGLQNGDTLSSGSANVSSSATRSSGGHLSAGTHVVNVSASSDLGYALSVADGTLNVTPASLSLGGLTAANRTYNGTTAATIGTDSAVFNGLVAGDVVSVSGSAAFEDRHAGTGKTVNITGLALGGTDAANYTLAGTTASATADIYKAAITISTADVVRTYDGTVAAPGAAAIATVGQLYGTDSLSGGSFQFTDKNAGTNRTVTVAGVTVEGGNGGGNYEVTLADNVTSTINRAAISVSGITARDKTYDATTAAALDTSGASLAGLIGGDSVTLTSATGAFSDKNAGVDKLVTVTGVSLSGADALNYILDDATPTTATATIDKATISAITGITVRDKPYDGTTNAAIETSGAVFNGKIPGDVLILSGGSGSFADSNPGFDKPVQISGLVLSGEDAANYVLAEGTAIAAADIREPTPPPPIPPVSQPAEVPTVLPPAGGAAGESSAGSEADTGTRPQENAGTDPEANSGAGTQSDSGGGTESTSGRAQLITLANADLPEASTGHTLAENKSRTALDAVLYGDSKAALVIYTLSKDGVLTVELPESVPWKSLGDEAVLRKLASEKLGVEIGEIREVRVKTTKA